MSEESVNIDALSGAVVKLSEVIVENKAWLSEIDGAIGDGDHGINMAKGFSITAEKIAEAPGGFSQDLSTLSRVLMTQIGGSMGPLYGMFFKAIADKSKDLSAMDLEAFAMLVGAAHASIGRISKATPGDKTLMDCLSPAVDSLNASVEASEGFKIALEKMKVAAEKGRDSTKDMVAKLGRSSRLGERSRGVLDAGACSCNLILATFADEVINAL